MKKLIAVMALCIAGLTVNAASVNWNVAGTSEQIGYQVYLLTSIAESYESLDALASASVSSAEIKSLGRGKYGTGDIAAAGSSVTTSSMTSAFFAIVTGTDATSFKYVSANLSGSVYDPDNQESSSGSFADVTTATILAGTSKSFGGGGDVPEPTSGLLLLVGGAMLALRRKQK